MTKTVVTILSISFPIMAVLVPKYGFVVDAFSVTAPQHLVNILLSTEYNRHSYPTQNMGAPTNVSISMHIEGLSAFAAETMDFHVDIYFQERWNDPRLAHNSPTRILVKDREIFEMIWHPDIYFANARSAEFHYVTAPNFLVWIYQDGTVYHDARISLTVMCMMDLANYPLDSQTCNIRILSYAYDQDQLQLQWVVKDPIQKNPDIRLPNVYLRSISPEHCNGTYAVGVWSCISAVFNVQREIMHHVLQTYVPTGLIVVLSWLSFWIDIDAVPGRISLCITTLLTLATQSSAARLSLPQVSYIKAIDVWLSTCMAFAFGVMIEFTIVNYWARRPPKPPEEPKPFSATGTLRRFTSMSRKQKKPSKVPAPTAAAAVSRYDDAPLLASPCYEASAKENDKASETNEKSPSSGHIAKRPGSGWNALKALQRPSGVTLAQHQESPAAADEDHVSSVYTLTTKRGAVRGGIDAEPDSTNTQARKWLDSAKKLRLLTIQRNRQGAQNIDRKARYVFPLSFIVFNVGYWTYYLYLG